jgi:hypothetical protein
VFCRLWNLVAQCEGMRCEADVLHFSGRPEMEYFESFVEGNNHRLTCNDLLVVTCYLWWVHVQFIRAVQSTRIVGYTTLYRKLINCWQTQVDRRLFVAACICVSIDNDRQQTSVLLHRDLLTRSNGYHHPHTGISYVSVQHQTSKQPTR